MKKRIAILGSTGSIGTQTLTVAQHLEEEIEVIALAARSNIDLLEAQVKLHKPKYVAVYNKEKAALLQRRLPHLSIFAGMEGLIAIVTISEVDFVVSAMVGAIGIIPTYRAIGAGKEIGLANKEVLIAAGSLIMKYAREKEVTLFPIDSEHSGLFQCLQKEKKTEIKKIILTASGGPFFSLPRKKLCHITPKSALKHPNWKMGRKLTIDSSTLMNKGLEVIEAHHLFGFSPKEIEVVVHPQSIIHSMIECIDGSLLAQLAEPDMKGPIQYALTYPERKKGTLSCFDFRKHSKLEFFLPDIHKFPCLQLAYIALEEGGTLPCFMNAANEVLVERFLQGNISWLEIGKKLEQLMNQHCLSKVTRLEDLLAVDAEAREEAQCI